MSRLICMLVAASLVLAAPPVLADSGQHQHDHAGTDPDKVGVVTFENSCSPAVQEQFGRGIALLHSFWYEEVERRFREVVKRDPDCAMARWGIAMAQWQPLWEPRGPSRDRLNEARVALQDARGVKRATPREREYLAALEKFVMDFETVDHTVRVQAYEQAMGALHAKYPKDSEAAVFYSLALLSSATSLPPDKTYARQRKAGELLQPIFRAQPEHPGGAHYIIHAFDYPPLASGALEAARRYANVAPDSPHAQHMPSHIFTRLGLWEESIASNRMVVATARKYNVPGEQLHGSDYLVFAHLQRGEDEAARRAIDESPKLADVPKTATLYFAAVFATAAMPARYAIERGQWAEAAALPEPAGFPGGRYAWADAAIYFARALGAARTKAAAQARRDIEQLRALHQTLTEHKETYWATQVDVQRRAADAWLALAEGRRDDALEAMRAAAALEDTQDKHPVTPGAIVPTRLLLGDMLLELERPADALAEYLRVLEAEPNRFRALYGAARAAEASGQQAKAREMYAALVKAAPKSTRSEVEEARKKVKAS